MNLAFNLGRMRVGLLALAAGLLAACDNPRAASAETAASSAGSGLFAYTPPAPGDDFYNHVNGAWIASYRLPADKYVAGLTADIGERTEEDIRDIIEGLPPSGTDAAEGLISVFYASLMDTGTIETRGLAPLKPLLDRVAAVKTKQDVVLLWGATGFAAPFYFSVDAHPDRPEEMALWIGQAGLGMPDLGYYRDAGVREELTRLNYRAYITDMMRLLHHPDPAGASRRIYALEKKLADAHEFHDPEATVEESMTAMSIDGLQSYAQAIDWRMLFKAMHYEAATSVVISDGLAVAHSVALLDDIPVEDWKDWFAFHLINDFAPYLPQEIADRQFDFMSRRLFGIEKKPERWRFAVQEVNSYLGDAVGELYVARHFPPEHKRQIEEMYDNIRTAFAARIDRLDWMDEETRAQAHAKLDTLVATIGYPDDPTDYSGLRFERGKLIENVLAGYDFYDRMMREMLGEPADNTSWAAPAQTVNAFYNSLNNSLVLPAGILKPPFFDPKADAAVNYGGIGAIIGHEISHGFDDQGRQMDEHGARRNWWTQATNEKFLESSQTLVQQYGAYCRSFDLCVDGAATLSENIADLAGMEVAYDAYKASLGGKDSPVIDGKTGEQRFFLNFALQYREKLNEEVTRSEFRGGGHSPAIYRVNGVVRNMDAWYEAFGVTPASKLYLSPNQRVNIW